EEALELVSGRVDIDIVLSDILLSGSQTGLQLAKKLYETRPELPVAFMSGWSRREALIDDRPGLSILPKPFTMDQLANHLQRILDRQAALLQSPQCQGRRVVLDRFDLPVARRGMRVGLLGGSFDPPHQGHVHITREALKRFDLDRVWWLVSPGNPLKSDGPAPLENRLAAARAIMQHPRVRVTGIEARLGTRYTAETIACLFRLYPGVRFVWLMGADNLAAFHRWDNWERILRNVPVGVLARPGARISARTSRAARAFESFRLASRDANRLGRQDPPAWCFLNVPMDSSSSTKIRARGDWVNQGSR
ncbi:unnamed protein product, partial [Cyprideis torosa]